MVKISTVTLSNQGALKLHRCDALFESNLDVAIRNGLRQELEKLLRSTHFVMWSDDSGVRA